MYKEIFKLENFTVDVANDGMEGLEKVESMKPDIILCDVMMPSMNGIEVLKQLKTSDDTKSIPVIMLSNLDDDASIKEALDIGAEKYLLKSAHDPKEITEIAQSVLTAKA